MMSLRWTWLYTISLYCMTVTHGFGSIFRPVGPFIQSPKWPPGTFARRYAPLHSSVVRGSIASRMLRSKNEVETRILIQSLKKSLDALRGNVEPAFKEPSTTQSPLILSTVTPTAQLDEPDWKDEVRSFNSARESKRGTWFTLAEARRRAQCLYDQLKPSTPATWITTSGGGFDDEPELDTVRPRKSLMASPRVG
ncbi:hypothetical protein BV898_03162 [Hypsibius exemplaris]|uniref:Uncharacterized protein n=1 Tax=Hypsibius exemplaris TaxID=2072580 RepID=A0A1W0X5X4_HYPEX|nr:hypothetical protein BV898_03162 [Hypsibius exemplaris]